jgi:hypothetical protein
MRRQRIRAVLSVATIAIAMYDVSCASATKRYEQGKELEQQGRAADAAQHYIDALRKDPTYSEARERLMETGGRAVADDIRAADGLEATGVYTDAADALRTADALSGAPLRLAARWSSRSRNRQPRLSAETTPNPSDWSSARSSVGNRDPTSNLR